MMLSWPPGHPGMGKRVQGLKSHVVEMELRLQFLLMPVAPCERMYHERTVRWEHLALSRAVKDEADEIVGRSRGVVCASRGSRMLDGKPSGFHVERTC